MKPRVTLVTSSELPNLYPGEEGLPDELAQRGCDPQVKRWDDPDVDWQDAGLVIVRSVCCLLYTSDAADDAPRV